MIKNLNLFILSKYLLDLAPRYISEIEIKNTELSIYTNAKNMVNLIKLLKQHNNLRFVQLVDICGVDYIEKKQRFEVIYNFLSLKFGVRIKLKIKTSELKPVPSISSIFSSAN